MNRSSLGKKGEILASKFLTRKGIKVVERNVRTPFGEIDIVGKRLRKYYFIEVKTRRSTMCGAPQEAINKIKKEHMINSALYYLKGQDVEFEIGVVSILEKKGEFEIEYINDTF